MSVVAESAGALVRTGAFSFVTVAIPMLTWVVITLGKMMALSHAGQLAAEEARRKDVELAELRAALVSLDAAFKEVRKQAEALEGLQSKPAPVPWKCCRVPVGRRKTFRMSLHPATR